MTSIDEEAFSDCSSLKSVTIPDSVTSIGDEAFSGCSSLTSVTIPDSVTSIGKAAFFQCDSITSVTIPDSVTSISNGAFTGCRGLADPSGFVIIRDVLYGYYGRGEKIVIPDGVTSIGYGAFYWRTSLKSVTIPDGVTSIGDRAFSGCSSLTSVTIPNSVTSIGDEAFSGCSSLTSVTIPDSVTSFGKYAFAGCSSLTSVTIPDSVTSIGSSAFSGCSDLTSVTIPNSVTSIGDEAFSGCRSLTSVTILGGNVTIGKEMIKGCPALERLTLHHWNPNLKDFPRDDKHILICTEDKIADLPANRRLQAAAGFALLPNKDMTTDWAKSYLDYIKKNAIKLINVAFKETALMQLMCEYSLIPAKDYDAYLAEAEKSENAETKAMVLAYMKKLGIASLSIAREKNEKKVDAFEEAWINRMAKRDPSQGLEGVTFVIAGKLNLWKTRDEVKEFLELQGAHLGTKITKKTDYLVINDRRSNPAIVIEAEGYGIPVKTENEFNEMIGAKYQDAKNITIPSGLKVIRKEAFSGCRSLTSVTIPDSSPPAAASRA